MAVELNLVIHKVLYSRFELFTPDLLVKEAAKGDGFYKAVGELGLN